MFATTAVIMKQEIDEAESIKYFPKILLPAPLEILPAPRNIKPVKRTVAIFSPTKARMFVWMIAAKRGLTSIAPFPVTPITVVSKSAAPKRNSVEQIIDSSFTMRLTSS